MKKIYFEKYKRSELFEYHFYPKDEDEDMMIQHDESFTNNEVLWKDWCNQKGVPESFEKYSITNYKTKENSLLYLLLINQLSVDKSLYGIGIDGTEIIKKELKQEPILVDWEYQLVHEYVQVNKYIRIDEGFIRAHNSTIYQYGKSINKTPTDKTGLFYIEDFQALVDFRNSVSFDATNLINLFVVNAREHNHLMNELRRSVKPSLENILNHKDVFVALLIGEDMGYYDYLVIQAKTDISHQLNVITSKSESFTKEYISEVKLIETSSELILLIDRLMKKYAL